MTKNKTKKVLKIVIFILGIFLLTLVFQFGDFMLKKYQVKNKTSPLSIKPTPQVWAHAGYKKGVPGNSILAFTKAFEHGAKGIELDSHFDSKLFKFVISHNYPYQTHDGKLLYLEEVFKKIGKSGYYWLDLKNLSEDNIDDITTRLKYLLDRYDLKRSVFVESWHWKEISELSHRDIQTIYWIGLKHPPGSFDHFEELYMTRKWIAKSNFYAISGTFELFLRYKPDLFGGFPIFVFTINDPEVLEVFKSNWRVKVILTDEPSFY